MTNNSGTVCDILLKLYRNVYRIKTMFRVQFQLISVSQLWPFDCSFILISCNLHSCNSLTVHDDFMQFYRNVYR